ncbi:hypothetical protein AB0D54_26630 [Streptomyces xanthophaeus]|uniref:hypothetical protein n=1 Tax=Streptomyces xanthophaeus TaxID=67385 RepID=UPI0034207515
MINSPRWMSSPPPDGLPHHHELLAGTDWASNGTGAPPRPRPGPQGGRRQGRPRCGDPPEHRLRSHRARRPLRRSHPPPPVDSSRRARPPHRPRRHPTREGLLDWLGATAYDAADESLALHEHHCGSGFLAGYWPIRAFRDLRPAIFSAVQPLLSHAPEDVRAAALVAAVPLAQHPALTTHRAELADHARRLLATSTDRYRRDRALGALKAWGHDTGTLENPPF